MSKRWLSRPGKNPNYKRGKFLVKSGAEKKVFLCKYDLSGDFLYVITEIDIKINSQEYTKLPADTLVEFYSEADKFDNLEKSDDNKQRITSIMYKGTTVTTPENSDNTGWYIELSYEEKKTCNDRLDENYCDYIGKIPTNMSKEDEDALIDYKKHYGIPYYNSKWDKPNIYGGKLKLLEFDVLRSKGEHNWYSYPEGSKPNSPNIRDGEMKGVGLDCSGLIMNCLLDIRYNGNNSNLNDKDRFFKVINDKNIEDENNFRAYGEDVSIFGPKRTRPIPHKLVYNNNTLIQSADFIYVEEGNAHIALCAINQNEYVCDNQISTNGTEQGNFKIIHNYGGDFISYLTKGSQPIKDRYFKGFFKKTLCGPFRHWEVNFGTISIQAKAGRVYLWY
jgi:hypothetical protein